MKFNKSWLDSYIDTGLSPEDMGAKLTLAGLELDSIEKAAPEFSGVVVARIEKLVQHPDANKLRIATVNDGKVDDLQVICGAANAYEGMVTALATVGAKLPDGMKIKKAKLRGVESYGMLCSVAELGLADSADGIMDLPQDAPVGTSIRDYLDLDDAVLEVDLTPNRADCFSLRGIARELGVLTDAAVTGFEAPVVSPGSQAKMPATVQDTAACPVYACRVISGVDMKASTPLWMAERLRRCGLRSLNPVIDVTNYVMLELGQPMHAFDLAKISGGIVVRQAVDGESLTLLDGKEVSLKEGTLVIADDKGALAMAGIMGGADSAVGESTQDIVLESAFFTPEAIAGRSRSYGLHTESSHRFERGVDFDLQLNAMERATQLITELAGGEAGEITLEKSERDLPALEPITLREAQIKRRLGIEMDSAEVDRILAKLGCVGNKDGDRWTVVPPSYRFDLRIEVDLIEELARIYGYDKIPSSPRSWAPSITKLDENRLDIDEVKRFLVDLGYQEIISYSFVDKATEKTLNPAHKPLALANPISAELAVMRSSLWSGMLKAVSYNQRRQQPDMRLFETGLVFQQESDGLKQPSKIAGVITGASGEESWYEEPRPVDFFDIKGDLEALLGLTDKAARISWEPVEHHALHPGQSAALRLDGDIVGVVGALHPQHMDALELQGNVFLFELDLDVLSTRPVPAFEPLSRFPAVRRDLALLVDENVSYSRIREAIKALDLDIIQDVRVFDVYTGEGVANGLKSVALGLILQDFSRTLEESDVEKVVEKVLAQLKSEVQATLRE